MDATKHPQKKANLKTGLSKRALRSGAFATMFANAIIIVGCSGGTQSPLTSLSQAVHASGPRVRPKFVVQAPANGNLYLGAWVNPTGGQTPPPATINAETLALEQTIYGANTPQQHFALHMHYMDWLKMSQISTNPEILDDITNGRVPVISWNCGDDMPPYSKSNPLPLTGITAGTADPDLATIKAQLAMLKYLNGSEYPIILRYFWEFNINATESGSQDNQGNGNNSCFTGASSGYPSEFKDAWNHIHQKLGPAGVPNLTWDWNPNIQDTDSVYNNGFQTPASPGPFYPGNTTVDWIGVDGYDKLDLSGNVKPFGTLFDIWYDTFSASQYGGKPMMIGETGSCQWYGLNGLTPDQTSYVQTLESILGPKGVYPQVYALLYFDAPGGYNPVSPSNQCHWDLNSTVQSGDSISSMQAFSNLATDPKFTNKVTPP